MCKGYGQLPLTDTKDDHLSPPTLCLGHRLSLPGLYLPLVLAPPSRLCPLPGCTTLYYSFLCCPWWWARLSSALPGGGQGFSLLSLVVGGAFLDSPWWWAGLSSALSGGGWDFSWLSLGVGKAFLCSFSWWAGLFLALPGCGQGFPLLFLVVGGALFGSLWCWARLSSALSGGGRGLFAAVWWWAGFILSSLRGCTQPWKCSVFLSLISLLTGKERESSRSIGCV